jgi:SAM-dependent methyltransferase
VDGEWESTRCANCGTRDDKLVFPVPHRPGPDGGVAFVECRRCGLRRIDPRPSPELLGQYYGAQSGAGYNAYAGRRRHGWRQQAWECLRDGASHPSRQNLMSRALGPITGALARWFFDINVDLERRAGLRVLEVGCGYGDLLLYLRSRGCEVLGTDISPDAAAKAAEYGLEVRCGEFARLGLPAAHYDVAILSHSLEHVPDPNVELRDLARVLKPGGHLYIAVPNGCAGALEIYGPHWPHLCFPLHLWMYTPESLATLLRKHGFELACPARTSGLHHPHVLPREWQRLRRSEGARRATRMLARYVSEVLRRGRGDFLRVVAIRNATD